MDPGQRRRSRRASARSRRSSRGRRAPPSRSIDSPCHSTAVGAWRETTDAAAPASVTPRSRSSASRPTKSARLAARHGEPEAGRERLVERADVVAPRPEAALLAASLEGERRRRGEARGRRRPRRCARSRSATNSVGTSSSQPSSPVNETRNAQAWARADLDLAAPEERPGVRSTRPRRSGGPAARATGDRRGGASRRPDVTSVTTASGGSPFRSRPAGPALGERRCQDEEPVVGEPGDRRVQLDAAALVGEDRVDDPARRRRRGRTWPAAAARRARPARRPRTSRTSSGRTARRPRGSPGPRRGRPGTTTGPCKSSGRSGRRTAPGSNHSGRSQPPACPSAAPAAGARGGAAAAAGRAPSPAACPASASRTARRATRPSARGASGAGSPSDPSARRRPRRGPSSGGPARIHSAAARPTPGPKMIPCEFSPAATNRPGTSGTKPSWRLESGVKLSGPRR